MAPLLSAADSPASQLLRIGLEHTLSFARAHLRRGLDYSDHGVLERRVDKRLGLPKAGTCEAADADSQNTSSSRVATASERAGLDGDGAGPDDPVVWHPLGGWLRPAALVQALLATPGVRWQGGHRLLSASSTEAEAAALVERVADETTGGAGLAANRPQSWSADLVVLAMGASSAPWLGPQWPLHPVRGQVSLGLMPGPTSHHTAPSADAKVNANSIAPSSQRPLPHGPINGHGSWVSGISLAGQAHWVCGATYERGVSQALVKPEDHRANWTKLQRLLPQAAAAVAEQFEQGRVSGWSGVRCTTADRLPVLGPRSAADARVWLCTGLGSRGLSWSVLCGELLAARWLGEPLPVSHSLAAHLDSLRPLR